jgi:hypothetical protein
MYLHFYPFCIQPNNPYNNPYLAPHAAAQLLGVGGLNPLALQGGLNNLGNSYKRKISIDKLG